MRTIPSLKAKKRYVFFDIISDRGFSYSEARGAIFNSLENWMGDKAFGSSGVRLIKNLWKNDSGVIQCSHRSVDDVKVGLGLIHQIADARVIFHSRRVSGTIKAGSS
jgi:ribonuclease P/MRP protein subunit POP5